MNEQSLHVAIARHLTWRGPPRTNWFHVPNGGRREPVEAGILKTIGVRAGVPDLIFVREGRLPRLELKTENGPPPSSQALMIEELRSAGAFVEIGYGLDQYLSILEGWETLAPARSAPKSREML